MHLGADADFLVFFLFRPDPLYNELHTGMKNEDSAVRDTYIQVSVVHAL